MSSDAFLLRFVELRLMPLLLNIVLYVALWSGGGYFYPEQPPLHPY